MSEEAAVVRITGSFDIVQIEEAHTRLQEALASHRQVVLDLSEALGIDLAGLQLICAVHRTALEAGINFSLALPASPCLADCARLAGFSSLATCNDNGNTTCLWIDAPAEIIGEVPHD
jgi:anti-anti-sigma regulatory factor